MFDKIIERIVRKVIKERLDQVVDEIGKGYNIEPGKWYRTEKG